MKVLLITGEGFEKITNELRGRFKDSTEILTIDFLDQIDTFFMAGMTFDKAVILKPNRVIRNYDFSQLKSELFKFLDKLSTYSSPSQEIIFLVDTEEEGILLAENTCNSGNFFIIQKEGGIVRGDLVNLISQQGSTLEQRYTAYNLAKLKRMSVMKAQQERKEQEQKILSGNEEFSGAVGAGAGGFGLLDDTDDFDSSSDGTLIGGVNGLSEEPDDDFSESVKRVDFGEEMWNLTEDVGTGKSLLDDSEDEEDDPFEGMKINFDDNDEEAETELKPDEDWLTTPSKAPDLTGAFNSSNTSTEGMGGFGSVDTEEKPEVKPTAPKKNGFLRRKAQETPNERLSTITPVSESTEEKDKPVEKPSEKPKRGGFLKRKSDSQSGDDIGILSVDEEPKEKPKRGGFLRRKVEEDTETVEEPKEESRPIINQPIKKGGLFKKKQLEPEELETTVEETDSEVHFEDSEPEQETEITAGLFDESSDKVDDTDNQMVHTLFQNEDKTLERGKGKGIEKTADTSKLSAKAKITKKAKPNNELNERLALYRNRGAMLVFTGSNGTGKTVISGNIANLLCKMGYSVCILDLDTVGKGQTYLNREVSDMIHSTQDKSNNIGALNSSGGDFSRYLDVVRPGLHMITSSLGSDSVRPEQVVTNKHYNRLIHELTSTYNFVIVDAQFQDLKGQFTDFIDSADSLIFVEEATTHGMVNFMLNLANVEDEATQSVIFHRGCLLLNKEDGMTNFLGRKVDDTEKLLQAIDEVVYQLQGGDSEYHFADLHVVGVIPYNKNFEPFWYAKKFISDTENGEKLFMDLLKECV